MSEPKDQSIEDELDAALAADVSNGDAHASR